MNLAELDKEKKQLLFLGVIVLVTLCYVGFNYGLTPFFQRWEERKSELMDLENDLRKARRLSANRTKIESELETAKKDLRGAFDQYLPNKNNPLSWATQSIYQQARANDIDITAVSETGGTTDLNGLVSNGARHFQSYSVRIITNCSYQELRQFVHALQQSNPYLCAVGISVAVNSAEATRHAVNVDVEWPCLPSGANIDVLFDPKGA